MRAVVENHSPLIKFDEKAETPSNITVLLLAWVSVWSGCLKTVFLLVTLLGHHQGRFFMTVKEQTPVSWASTRPICSYYCCQETDVSSHTGKKVCLWLWSCASARYGCVWVFVCACAGCGRVGFGKYDLAFPTPGFCPWQRVKCTATSGHTVLLHHTHTHTHTEHKRGGSARERSCVTVRWPWSAVVKPRELGGKWLHIVWHLISLLKSGKDTCTRDQMCRDISLIAPSE